MSEIPSVTSDMRAQAEDRQTRRGPQSELVVEGRFPPSGAYRPSRRSLPLTEPSLLLRGTQLWPCKSTHKQYNSGDSELRKKIPV